ncbi:hypothetical protein BZG36_03974 [Bifiguratus adelaidae]|uniref:hydroxymethylglutaryl-CoA lyase n=1 Tax=Bifiguratus adelaidae TaxID=1938954 RepID=A0A261XXQ5_9FUNG|nr:hypothetical protein BZG36_03974 [Bifiguratus adelaidae]
MDAVFKHALRSAVRPRYFSTTPPARSATALPNFVKIVEVGPRDGLQNEKQLVPTETKVELVNRLGKTGIKVIETTSFVSPKWVPQMGDNKQVMQAIDRHPDISYPVLAPNVRGLDGAIEAGAEEVAVFIAASEAFSKRNLNCTIKGSMEKASELITKAKANNVRVRGYVSCALGCPFQGHVDPAVVAGLSKDLMDLGCYEVSIGDTIGVGTPGSWSAVLDETTKVVGVEKLAAHCHDTYGQALANIHRALEHGLRVVDSSVAGLGGCPYAPGATGNVATEDVVYSLHGSGYQTGIDLDKLVSIGHWISAQIGRPNVSRAGKALQLKAKI